MEYPDIMCADVALRGSGRVATCVVLLIDHQPLFLEALAGMVATIPFVRVVSHVLTDGLGCFPEVQPDVIVIDPSDAGAFSTGCLETMKRLWPLARLMVVTEYNDPDAIVGALGCGAHSFILKSEPVETIRTAVELLCRGGSAFSEPVATLLAAKVAPAGCPPFPPVLAARGLSPREVEVLHLSSRGHSDAEIASSLNISPRTAQRHMTNILNKLNCRNRSQAAALALGSTPPRASSSP